MAAVASTDVVRIRLNLDEITALLQLFHNRFTALKALQADKFAAVFVDVTRVCIHAQHRKSLPHRHFKIIRIMRRRNFHSPRTEFHLAVFITHDRYFATHSGDNDRLSNEVLVARIFGIHGNAGVTKHSLRACCRHRDGIALIRRIITHMPEVAVLFLIFHLGIGQRSFAVRAPINDAITAINQALVIETHKYLRHSLAAAFIHGKAFPLPIARRTKVAKLLYDGGAVFVPPSPGALQEAITSNILFRDPLFCHLFDNLDLSCNRGMIRARHPECFISAHALISNKNILQCFIDGMPHMQPTSDVRRRNNNGIWWFSSIGACMKISVFFPLFIKCGFHTRVVVGFFHLWAHTCFFPAFL